MRRLPRLGAAAVAGGTATHAGGAPHPCGVAAAQQPGACWACRGSTSPGHGSRMAAALASVARKRDAVLSAREVISGDRAARLAAEQSAKGALRPWHDTAAGYLAVLFEDAGEARRA